MNARRVLEARVDELYSQREMLFAEKAELEDKCALLEEQVAKLTAERHRRAAKMDDLANKSAETNRMLQASIVLLDGMLDKYIRPRTVVTGEPSTTAVAPVQARPIVPDPSSFGSLREAYADMNRVPPAASARREEREEIEEVLNEAFRDHLMFSPTPSGFGHYAMTRLRDSGYSIVDFRIKRTQGGAS